MNDQQRVIQRLWYTAPPGEGFRNCAVTDGLKEDLYQRGPQIRALERYARYDPPDDIGRTDASIFVEAPDLELAHKTDAPISLSLIEIRNPEVLNNEDLARKLHGRVLVNRIYLGKVGAKSREGNVFIDLLANLPDGFSAREALALWRATDFWQQRYAPAYAGIIKQLPPTELPTGLTRAAQRHLLRPASGRALEPLRNPFARTLLAPETEQQLTELLTFLIHAYLLQQQEEWLVKYNREHKRKQAWLDLEAFKKTQQNSRKIEEKEREYRQLLEQQHQEQLRFKRIYVAAEDDRLAYCLTLLASLFQDIPELLLPLTFSTYEYDVLGSDCLIIGTSPSRAAENESKRLEKLLPPECERLGYIYNVYAPASNTPLPSYLRVAEQQPQEPLRVESVARYLARKLMQPGERFAKHLNEVAERISTSSPAIPAQLFILLWQQKLVVTELLRKPYLSRKEVMRLLQDAEWGEFLEEPEISRQVFQWVIADCNGLDLELPATSRIAHPQRTGIWQAQKAPDAQTLPELITQCVQRQTGTPGGAALAASLATELCSLLEEYADNLPQPALYGREEDSARRSPAHSEHPCFDVIGAYKRARDPESFDVLLNLLRCCEQAAQSTSAGKKLPGYLFSTRQSAGQRVFLHAEAGAFVLRHLYDPKLTDQLAEQHWHLHRDLLHFANQVLPETLPEEQLGSTVTPLELVTPLLHFPLRVYWFLYGEDTTRRRWYASWRQEALIYQINKLRLDGSTIRFTGHHWERLRITARDIQDCRALISTHWQTHYLLVSEAIDCLDAWEHALPLFDEQSPPFQAELLQRLETLEQVNRIQHMIWQQTETAEPQNIEAVIRFYQKLLRGGYSQANTLRLLVTWHESWMLDRLSTQELRSIFAITTKLSQDVIQGFLLENKEVYKRRKAEELLVSLYERYQQARSAQPAGEEAAHWLLFQLLDGAAVSHTTLDGLLTLANLDHLRKVEFFARLGRTYLPAYFKQSTQERSRELLGLFTRLISEDQALQNQTLKPGQPFPTAWRKVILALFWLWLSAAGDDEIVDWLFERVNPQPGELLFLLATFGATYMTARRARLKELCQNYFKQLCAQQGVQPAEKLLLCLNLLPPESFPCLPGALSAGETLAILQTAALAGQAIHSFLEKPSLLTDVRVLLAQQEAQPGIQAQVLVRFLQEQGCKADELLPRLQTFLEQATCGANELIKDVETFQARQAYPHDYAASELELFLEIQEHRVKGNYPPEIDPPQPAVYLRYLVVKQEAEQADPFKKVYLSYLQEFSTEGLAQREGSIHLLTLLSGTGAVEKSIDDLSNGLVAAREFLQTCQRVSRQTDISYKNGEEEEAAIESAEIRNLESALQKILQAGLRSERYQLLAEELIRALVPCVSDQSDVSRICKLGPVLCESRQKNLEFALFLKLSQQASKYYRAPVRQQRQSEWFAPYLETLPLLRREFGITRETMARRAEIMQALLFVNNDPDEQTLLALDAYLQRAAAGRLLQKVVDLWERYKAEDPRIGLALNAARQAPPALTEEQAPLPIAGLPSEEETPPFAFVSREQDLAERRISWFDSLQTVYRMRQAIRRADRLAMQKLCEVPKTYYIVHLYRQQIGHAYWERFQSLRQLDDAYRDLLATSTTSPDFQQYENRFLECKETCQDLERRKWRWRASLSPEQQRTSEEIGQRRQVQTANRPTRG